MKSTSCVLCHLWHVLAPLTDAPCAAVCTAGEERARRQLRAAHDHSQHMMKLGCVLRLRTRHKGDALRYISHAERDLPGSALVE